MKTVSDKVVRHSLAYLSVHKWLVGDVPFYLKFSTNVTHPLLKDSQPFRSRANSLPGAKVPIGSWPIRSLELSLPGPFVPWNFRSRAFSLPGTFALWNFRSLELSLHGANWPWNFRSLELDCFVLSDINTGLGVCVGQSINSVSYTHLTLPTIYSV